MPTTIKTMPWLWPWPVWPWLALLDAVATWLTGGDGAVPGDEFLKKFPAVHPAARR